MRQQDHVSRRAEYESAKLTNGISLGNGILKRRAPNFRFQPSEL